MSNLLDPAILFFVFGVFAGAVRSNLEIPPPIAKFLSLYLLMALGLKGGFALAASGLQPTVLLSLGAAVLMAALVPLLGYAWLRRRLDGFNAAALAAAYGSVSAVTFVAAMQYLEGRGLPAGGHMAVALVLMESPAVVIAVLLANRLRHQASAASGVPPLGRIVHESLTHGAHLLLLGAMAVGVLSGESGRAVMQPFSGDLFKGMLAFFMLDMGLLVARNAASLRGQTPALLAYATLGPLVHATLALALASLLRLPAPDAAMLMVLSASASYIVVPAVLRYAVPEANPSLYFGLSLGITFPLNLLAGIPLYTWAATRVLG
ncbi:MAG: sodium-dependent bicarbonate transport family permease [Rhodoferax sp.]|nr:sodium-dependent bicarbonate transport family permease [Rhodoferax sp.]